MSCRIIAYGWLDTVWEYEWFIIGRDVGSENVCRTLFMIWTIVCVALSKDVHLFALWQRTEGMRKQCKQCHIFMFSFLLWDKKG